MTKCGTALVTGNYVEFQAAVLRALPRDIDSEVALEWANNGERLARVLRETLMPSSKPADNDIFFPITVDYYKSVEDAVSAGRYDWANSNINSSNFSAQRKGKVDVDIKLSSFNQTISTRDALRGLNKLGMRSAELRELLAFGEKYHNVQREFPVVALGSVWRDSGGGLRVPYLNMIGFKRVLGLGWLRGGWGAYCRFAIVRK